MRKEHGIRCVSEFNRTGVNRRPKGWRNDRDAAADRNVLSDAKRHDVSDQCLYEHIGLIGSVSYAPSNSQIQVIDPTMASAPQTLLIPSPQFGAGTACAFSPTDGLLYVTGDSYTGYGVGSFSLPTIIAIDPKTMTIVKSWLTNNTIGFYYIAISQSGVVYVVEVTANAIILGIAGADGQYQQLSTTPLQYLLSLLISPNGYLYIGGLVFDQNGQRLPSAKNLGRCGGNCSASWPTDDPWFAYVSSASASGEPLLYAENLYADQEVMTLPSVRPYSSVFARRQSDGTDLVLGLGNGSLDIYQVHRLR